VSEIANRLADEEAESKEVKGFFLVHQNVLADGSNSIKVVKGNQSPFHHAS
jgi:hypothetical protein